MRLRGATAAEMDSAVFSFMTLRFCAQRQGSIPRLDSEEHPEGCQREGDIRADSLRDVRKAKVLSPLVRGRRRRSRTDLALIGPNHVGVRRQYKQAGFIGVFACVDGRPIDDDAGERVPKLKWVVGPYTKGPPIQMLFTDD